jgi:outer membrane protein
VLRYRDDPKHDHLGDQSVKKRVIAGVLALYCSNQAAAQTENSSSGWHGTLGVGPISFPKYVGGAGLETLPLPIAYVDYNEQFYVNLFRAGAYLWSTPDKKTGISFAVEPRLGFNASSGTKLAGMATRRGSVQGGPTFDWEGALGSVSVGYFADLMGASHGGYWDAIYDKSLLTNERWHVNGTIEISRLNAKMVNYYFGVRSTEAIPDRPVYQPGSTTNVTLWLTGQYALTTRYALMFGANVTTLGSAAGNSPIVERRYAPLFYVGLGWKL